MYTLRECLEYRANGQHEWLHKEHPEIFQEQRHCDEGTVERTYWHYGYMVALKDVIRWLDAEKAKLN